MIPNKSNIIVHIDE